MLRPRYADPSADTPAIRRDQLDAETFERRRDRLPRCRLWVSSPPLEVDECAQGYPGLSRRGELREPDERSSGAALGWHYILSHPGWPAR